MPAFVWAGSCKVYSNTYFPALFRQSEMAGKMKQSFAGLLFMTSEISSAARNPNTTDLDHIGATQNTLGGEL